jgi:hypothetical protein
MAFYSACVHPVRVIMRPVARQHLRERLYVASVVAAVSFGLAWGSVSFPPAHALLFVQVSLWGQLHGVSWAVLLRGWLASVLRRASCA